MGDPVSLASGVVALITFGFQASTSLYDAIQSLKNHSRTVRDLKSDLEVLQAALRDLEDLIGTEDEKDFVSLKHPIYCCGVACSEFETVVLSCTTNSTDSHRSIRDWTKLQFKNGDINRFRTTLAGYKSTIQVVMGGINLAKVTQKCLDEYRDLIENTKADLTEHLSDIEEELSIAVSGNTMHLRRMKQEQESTKRCLEMCDQVWTYIGQRQREAIQTVVPTDQDQDHDPDVHANTSAISSSQLTASTFADCRGLLAHAKVELEDRLYAKDSSTTSSVESENGPKVSRVKKCLELCESALREAEQTRVNVFEDVNVADDSKQYIVSTVGDLISAKRVTAGSRTTLVWGQMSDESLQQSFLHLATRVPSHEVPRTYTDSNLSFSQYGRGQPVGATHSSDG